MFKYNESCFEIAMMLVTTYIFCTGMARISCTSKTSFRASNFPDLIRLTMCVVYSNNHRVEEMHAKDWCINILGKNLIAFKNLNVQPGPSKVSDPVSTFLGFPCIRFLGLTSSTISGARYNINFRLCALTTYFILNFSRLFLFRIKVLMNLPLIKEKREKFWKYLNEVWIASSCKDWSSRILKLLW